MVARRFGAAKAPPEMSERSSAPRRSSRPPFGERRQASALLERAVSALLASPHSAHHLSGCWAARWPFGDGGWAHRRCQRSLLAPLGGPGGETTEALRLEAPGTHCTSCTLPSGNARVGRGARSVPSGSEQRLELLREHGPAPRPAGGSARDLHLDDVREHAPLPFGEVEHANGPFGGLRHVPALRGAAHRTTSLRGRGAPPHTPSGAWSTHCLPPGARRTARTPLGGREPALSTLGCREHAPHSSVGDRARTAPGGATRGPHPFGGASRALGTFGRREHATHHLEAFGSASRSFGERREHQALSGVRRTHRNHRERRPHRAPSGARSEHRTTGTRHRTASLRGHGAPLRASFSSGSARQTLFGGGGYRATSAGPSANAPHFGVEHRIAPLWGATRSSNLHRAQRFVSAEPDDPIAPLPFGAATRRVTAPRGRDVW